ncbi:diguanylate cyclase [Psychromonas sp. MME2]|uniref:GGDEF domain-containing response regulator n=1 Tax=unclassified Psychromonas TaxID=2614957 RepID=UPI00339BE7BB
MTSKSTILIVDDEPLYIDVLAQCLSADYHIIVARNSKEVLQRLKNTIPDLILLDIVMPDVCGYEICESLKESPLFAKIPVIFISALDEMDNEIRGLELGAVDFFSKPFRLPLIKLRIKNHLKLIEQSKLLQQLVNEDALTGIANRRKFDEFLAREWLLSQRYHSQLSLLMIDIDYFKQYNDTYGHAAGDQCLLSVAQTLSSLIARRTDIVCRYGGEEFTVILPDSTPEAAMQIAEKLRLGIENLALPHQGSQVSNCLSISIGVATTIGEQNGDAATLIKMADENLYLAKKAGRNRVM